MKRGGPSGPPSYISGTNSMMSPGWQSRYSHSRSSDLVSTCPSPFRIFSSVATPTTLSRRREYMVSPLFSMSENSLSYRIGILPSP
nr:MAG TPA: hypothetical protein [Caudoviricetes sp.]